MAGTLKVGTITTPSGSGSITIPSGVTLSGGVTNTPAFEAYQSSAQTLTASSFSKLNFDTELFDTDSCYDNSTNYRFTPTVAGKYFVYGFTQVYSGGDTRVSTLSLYVYKNGVAEIKSGADFAANNLRAPNQLVNGIVDMNGSTDYLEIYYYVGVSAGTPVTQTPQRRTSFGAYKIIGA